MQLHIAKNGQHTGPYSEAQVREMLGNGAISPTDLAWHEGLAGWMPLESVLSLGGVPAAVTPAPPAVIPAAAIQVQIHDPNLAGRGTRLGAKLLDTLILSVCLIPGLVALGVANKNDNITAIGAILLILAVLALTATQWYLLGTRGQTIGKKIVGIKIVNFADSQNPGFVKACLVRTIVIGMIAAVPYLGFLFSITDICFIFRDDKRCIHDLMAETKVVHA
jgi:uncharacterized RDD family membrane protein YckC